MPVDLGDVWRLTLRNTSAAGALVNATGPVSVSVTLPDTVSTVGPFTATNDSTGIYHYDYQTGTPGRHQVVWSGTGINPQPNIFDVRPAKPPYLVSLEDAKTHLNMTSFTDDDELRGFIEATTDVIEQHVGKAIVPRSVTEDHYGRRSITQASATWSYADQAGVMNQVNPRRLTLNKFPVITLTSVTSLDGVTSWDVNSLHVDAGGVVSVLSGPALFGDITVTYTAGMALIPASYTRAALIVIQHLWSTQRGTRGVPRPGGQDAAAAATTYVKSYVAQELLGPTMPGFA